MPAISVVVFARDSAPTIEQALDSVTAPENADVELIVLDGGSTDGTVTAIEKYGGHIAYFRSRPDGGPTNAINEGVERARGEVICLLPGDDWLERGALPFIANAFSQDRDLDVLTCGARIVRTDPSGAADIWAEYRDEAHLGFTLANILRNPLTCARFIRKRIYDKLGGMDNSWTFPDKEFLVRVYFSNARSKTHPRLVYNFRRHSGSATNSGRPEMTRRMLEHNIRLGLHYLATPGLSSEDRKALLRLHAGSSARLALTSGLRGDLANAGGTLAAAFRTNPAWALDALAWYYDSAQEKYRNARSR